MKKFLVFCDANVFCRWQRSADLRASLAKATCIYADGVSVSWATSWPRMTGHLYFESVLSAESEESSHFLYGASVERLRRLKSFMESRGAKVVGWYAPDTGPVSGWRAEQEVIDKLSANKVDYFWVFLGGEKQENWIATNLDHLNAECFAGIGAVVDFSIGSVARAPLFMQRLHLEWAHRLWVVDWRRRARNVLRIIQMSWYLTKVRVFHGKKIGVSESLEICKDDG